MCVPLFDCVMKSFLTCTMSTNVYARYLGFSSVCVPLFVCVMKSFLTCTMSTNV